MVLFDYYFRVTYPDTDRMGTMHHANYVRRFEEARWELFRNIGLPYSKIEEAGVMCPVVGMQFKFLKTTRYDECLRVNTHLVWIQGVRMRFEYQMFNENEELICWANTDVAFVGIENWKPMKIPQKLLDAIARYQLKEADIK